MNTTTSRPLRAAIHGAGYANLRRALAERLPFTTSGALRGEQVLGAWDSGRLAGPDREAFVRDRHSIRYIVKSYDTPIYWETADGTGHRVAQRFSATTSRHQGCLYLLDMGATA